MFLAAVARFALLLIAIEFDNYFDKTWFKKLHESAKS
jgi:hypothetical protein